MYTYMRLYDLVGGFAPPQTPLKFMRGFTPQTPHIFQSLPSSTSPCHPQPVPAIPNPKGRRRRRRAEKNFSARSGPGPIAPRDGITP